MLFIKAEKYLRKIARTHVDIHIVIYPSWSISFCLSLGNAQVWQSIQCHRNQTGKWISIQLENAGRTKHSEDWNPSITASQVYNFLMQD